MVPNSYGLDISLFIDGKSMYSAPLDKNKKLVYTCNMDGSKSRVLLAKSTNTPDVKSATADLVISPGDTLVFTMIALPKTEGGHATVLLNDITSNSKKRENLNKGKYVAVFSREE
jgi:hypothetical protein